MSELYKIGAVSKICGVPAHVIRYYEELGLVTSHRIGGSSTRYYDAFIFEQLLNIRTLRKLEFSIEEIQDMMSSPDHLTPSGTYRRWDGKQAELRGRIEELQKILVHLDRMKTADYYWQISGSNVITVDMPELYFFPQTNSDHSPADTEGAMDDVLDRLLPYIRKLALSGGQGDAFEPAFGFGIERAELELLTSKQRSMLRVLPSGKYYACAAKVDRRCIITEDMALPLYDAARRDGSQPGMQMFQLGIEGHLLCLLEKK